MSDPCSVCGAPHFCKGYCRKHYERWRRHGNPLTLLKSMVAKGEPLRWLEEHALHNSDECLIWPFARFPDGRAHMKAGKPTRIMCELAHGVPPSAIHEAAHSCGNGHKACVNPQHLRWATPLENAADKETHGTHVRGEAHYAAKLTADVVREIRAAYGTVPQKDLALRYGVGRSAINKIVHGLGWRHVQ